MSPWLLICALSGSALASLPDLSAPDWEWYPNVMSANAGYEAHPLGDVDGDGYDDFAAITSYGGPTIGVFHGSADGPEYFPRIEIDAGASPYYYDNVNIGSGDFNGDGYGDLVVGNGYEGGGTNGSVRIWFGSPTGIWPYLEWSYVGTQADAYFGWSVAGADVNGDGFDDLIVGAPFYDDGQNAEGVFLLFPGASVGPGTTPTMIEGSDLVGAYFGWALEPAGDVNGDGYDDIAVIAPWVNNGHDSEGRLYVYHGRPQGLRPSPSKIWEPDQALIRLGYYADHPADAGDFNGDGYSDLLVGVQYWSGGATSEGRAVAFYGSSGGLLTTPGWSVEGNQQNANLGQTVASAGDLDGDGYDDALVGAWAYSETFTTGGTFQIYRGGPTGLSPYPDAEGFGDQDNGRLGTGLIGAGDVNGDGAPDIVVGQSAASDGEQYEGRILAYFGLPLPTESAVEPIGGPGGIGASLDGDAPDDEAGPGGGCNTLPGAVTLAWLMPALAAIGQRRRR